MKKTLIIISVVLFILLILCFRPIINPKADDCDIIEGNLVKYSISPENMDIRLKLDNSDKIFYINRGLEQGYSAKTFDTLINKEIKLYPVKHWTLLDPKGKIKHLARVESQNKVIFSEF